jgi:hypothetical protein
MSGWLRKLLYSSLGLLWLSGGAWLVLRYFFQSTTDFGAAPHPWQPWLMMIHGVVAAPVLFLFGWVAGAHIGECWKRRVKRVSGILLITLIALLALTGLGSYYLISEPARQSVALIHEIAGVCLVLPGLFHWVVKRRPPAPIAALRSDRT